MYRPRSSGGNRPKSTPPSLTLPTEGAIAPAITRANVLLPAPLGPITAERLPGLQLEVDLPQNQSVACGIGHVLQRKPAAAGAFEPWAPAALSAACEAAAPPRRPSRVGAMP